VVTANFLQKQLVAPRTRSETDNQDKNPEQTAALPGSVSNLQISDSSALLFHIFAKCQIILRGR
jgi:hypothetical protein